MLRVGATRTNNKTTELSSYCYMCNGSDSWPSILFPKPDVYAVVVALVQRGD
jgi:hypothetical protein